MQKLVLALAAVAARGDESNPLAKVFELMDDCTAKVVADGEAAEKAFKEYYEWCDDTCKEAGFAIKTAKAKKEKLEASIEKCASQIEVSTSKVEDLAEAIAAAEKELEGATKVREEEAAVFAKAESELVDGVDTLDRAIGILDREMAKNPAAFAQIDTSNMNKVIAALGTVIDAASFTAQDKAKLTALVQSSSDEDDSEEGAPAPDAYKSKSGGIIDILNDMKEKAESELSDLRKVEGTAKQNYEMLKQSLEGQLDADNKELEEHKSGKEAAEQQKATDEGDLTITEKDLAESQQALAKTTSACLQAAADHEGNIKAREEELGVIAEAKKILKETTGGGAAFLQTNMVSRMDLKRGEIRGLVTGLAKRHHSAALAQLASQIGVIMEYGGSSADVFAKVKGLITDMIAKLEKEAEEDAAEKAYCDEEMSKTEAKKGELDDEIEKLSTKMDQAASSSTRLKGEVKEAQAELATLAKEQSEMDQIRRDQNAAYRQAKKDLELALGGVQKALEVLREYYGGGAALIQASDMAFMQQPAAPEKAEKSAGAGQSIISILEVCESDFSKNLAKEEQEESDAQSEYDTTTQENKITKTTREQDVKFKTQEFKALDASISELAGDKETSDTELAAVMEYYEKVKDRCVAKPESYEERTKRRNAEIEGLKNALSILEDETAFVQRKHSRKRSFRGQKLQ